MTGALHVVKDRRDPLWADRISVGFSLC